MKSNAVEKADRLMLKVASYCDAGALPDVYEGWEEYLFDFYPDLPWDESRLDSLKHIISEHTHTIARVKAIFGFDLEAELNSAIALDSESDS